MFRLTYRCLIRGNSSSLTFVLIDILLGFVGVILFESTSLFYPSIPRPFGVISFEATGTPIRNVDLDAATRINKDTLRVLDDIKTIVGAGAHLPRIELLEEIADLIKKKRIVLVSGAPGSGKSASAKEVLDKFFCTDALKLAFRSEEFAHPHLRAVPSFHGLSYETIQKCTAGFELRIVLIDSVERLLESASRQAFTDFLHEALGDPKTRVILTCRSYSAEVVRAAFLEPLRVEIGELKVPELTEAEVRDICEKTPGLLRPLEQPSLVRLLSNPFLLNMATKMDWHSTTALPNAERDFRFKVWREVIQRIDQQSDGMPMKRAKAFVSCARLRAETLRPFVKSDSFDLSAVGKLKADGLVEASRSSPNLIAPSHDVLEDWALLQSISEEFEECEGQLAVLLAKEKPFPAMRRAFAKWIDEWIEIDPTSSGGRFCRFYEVKEFPSFGKTNALRPSSGRIVRKRLFQ